mmetsp:Transcript_25291/g.41181  ORF Transcript_25291/g.41181 Transcript_25291/m.41181 type:complete len:81 (-) Transcript_25291:203-445(-)
MGKQQTMLIPSYTVFTKNKQTQTQTKQTTLEDTHTHTHMYDLYVKFNPNINKILPVVLVAVYIDYYHLVDDDQFEFVVRV